MSDGLSPASFLKSPTCAVCLGPLHTTFMVVTLQRHVMNANECAKFNGLVQMLGGSGQAATVAAAMTPVRELTGVVDTQELRVCNTCCASEVCLYELVEAAAAEAVAHG